MILYVNGDSHSAGCEAVHAGGFLQDNDNYIRNHVSETVKNIWQDEILWSPYPDNLEVSYGKVLADNLKAELHCHARSAGSNDRIIRTTYEYLNRYTPDFILIGWSTWEREEWYNSTDNTWYQIGGSGLDSVPVKWANRYKEYVVNVNWLEKTIQAHDKIWSLHQDLQNNNIPHLFFCCDLTFDPITRYDSNLIKDWGNNFIWPYSSTMSYGKYLTSQGCVHNKWYHFGADGHKKWADFLLPHLTKLL